MNSFGVLIALLIMLFWTPYLMARGVESLGGPVDTGEKIKCMIPVYNILRAEKNYYGGIKFCGISTILFVALTVFKLVTWLFIHANGPLNFISSILWILSILIVYIANCIFVFTVIKDSGVVEGFRLVLFTIIYPVGQYYIGTQIAGAILNAQKEAEAFRG